MSLVKLEIDGKRVMADGSQTILQVARQHGIETIPTLCDDAQLEPFASCFVCVVKVKGARSLMPACSTRVMSGMVVETNNAEVRQSRKAALELLLSDHYADCVGPCQISCPAGIDIQGYIALAAIGKYRDAIALIKQANPLPSVCGRVCTRPCEVKGCRRTLLDEAVGIDYIKRYISDLDLNSPEAFRPDVAPKNGRKVAIVGAGPAGLSAAYYLSTKGYTCEIFEGQPEPGGMLRYGIPEYRLPKDVLDLEIAQILGLGATLKTNTTLGKDFTIASLKQQGFEAVFLGIGAWRSSLMRVQNEDASGVLSGIEFLKNFGLRRKIDIHGTVCVVGGGNTAIDCARTALRLGVAEVKILYRRTRAEMPANDAEIRDAVEEGVKLELLNAPTRVVTDADGRLTAVECQRMELGEPDASGRRSPKPIRGSEFLVPCDFVIAAIGQSTTVTDLVDGKVPGFLPEGEALGLTRWQTVQVNDKTFETTADGVFSGGDVVTGAATAIEAIAAGRKAAYAIDTYIREGKARPEPEAFLSRKDVFSKITINDLRSKEEKPKRHMPLIPVDQRVKTFMEVELGYSTDDMREETTRCLECGCVALFDCDLRKYATDYGVDVKHFLGEARQHERDSSHPLIELDANKCILCGRCVRICSDVVGVSAYGFINRGFGTVVAPALGGSLLDTECVSCGLCIGTCPTGAIEQRLPLAKPGPWRTESTGSVCHYCGVGCRIDYDAFGDTLVKVSRNERNEVTFGNHCRKGRFGFNYVHDKDRLSTARVRNGHPVVETSVDEALAHAGQRLKELSRQYAGREMAVFVSPRMTNEEIYLAQKFARVALKTHNVTSFSHLVNRDLFAPDVLATATYPDVAQAQAILVVNSDLDAEHFVVDLIAKRAIRNGARLVYIGPTDNRTAQCSELFLQCAPDAQTLVLQAIVAESVRSAGQDPAARLEATGAVTSLTPAQVAEKAGVTIEAIREAAAILSGSQRKVLIFNRDYRGVRHLDDTRSLAAAARTLGCLVLPMHEKANMQGLLDMGAHPAWYPGYRSITDQAVVEDLEKSWSVALRDLDTGEADVARLLADKKIKVAVVLGEDPLGAADLPDDIRAGLEAVEFLVVADLFPTKTAQAAHVVLPMSSTPETSGTVTNSERRVQLLGRAIPPRSGYQTWQIITALAAKMGLRFKMPYGSPAEVFDEIRRVAPIYRHVAVGSQEPDAIWDASRFPLEEKIANATAAEVHPVPTAAFDHVDVRFERWFKGLFTERS
ncbi:MAG TPA: FAD-dependent oxidoreductase [Vicinamibacterales bacterium]|jgi:formate dehydrogenase major subunit